MKKILLALIVTTLLVVPVLVFAEAADPGEVPDINPVDALNTIINWAFYILMILAVFFLIMAGFMFVTARGNEDQLKKARTMLTYAVIGVVVALLARGAVTFIENVLKGTD